MFEEYTKMLTSSNSSKSDCSELVTKQYDEVEGKTFYITSPVFLFGIGGCHVPILCDT